MDSLFLESLIHKLNGESSFTTKDVYSFFPEMNNNTISWHLHIELEKGTIISKGYGKYILARKVFSSDKYLEDLPDLSKQTYNFLKNLNYEFYLSGLDSFAVHGLYSEGNYPVIICTTPNRVKDIQLELMREYDFALIEGEASLLHNSKVKSHISFVVLSSKDFSLQNNNFACPEKAFVDLYYAVTRLEYPLQREQLISVLKLFEINDYKFKKSTKDRKLGEELNFMINYDKAFIKAFANMQ
ncbi:MAG: hypothetical protein HUK23_05095 [Sphaerochaetaceae bacterium]|nr:hypothetical protein [Sphaerochaetaceae bacterium]